MWHWQPWTRQRRDEATRREARLSSRRPALPGKVEYYWAGVKSDRPEGPMTKPIPYASAAVSRIAPPPVYQPQVGVRQMKSALSNASPAGHAASAPPAYRPGIAGTTPVLQMKGNKCQVCSHRHGSVRCTVLVGGKACGCTSHSGHWGKGSNFNPGSGKHARMLVAMQGR